MATAVQVREQATINPWIVAISVMLATFLEILDTTVVNVSLRHIGGSLSATPDEATWVLTSYLVANAIILPMTGWLANYFGRKRILMLSMAGFTLSSVACGLAPNLPALLLFRVIQGLAGGGLAPLSQAILLEAFPPEKRTRAMAFWAIGMLVAPMLGPVLGGWITDSYSWRWLFYINLPIGAAGMLMSHLFIFDPPYIKRGKGGIDYWGIGLLAIGMGALQIMLDKGQEEDWFGSDWIVGLAVTAGVALAAFVFRELMTEHPVVNLRVFRNSTYATGVVLMTVLAFCLYGSTVLLPIFLQTLLGYSALDAGLTLLPRGFGALLTTPVIGMLSSRVEARKLIWFGFAASAYSTWSLASINLHVGYWNIVWPQFLQGIAMACVFVPLTTTTHDPIPKEQMGNATSIYNMMRNIGASIGIASITTIYVRQTQHNTNVLGGSVHPFSSAGQQMIHAARQMFISRGVDPVTATRQAYAAAFGMVQQQAAMLSFIHNFRLLGILFVCAMPLLLLMRKPRHQGSSTAAH
jgi:DHA2 family multidrug resistance protein